jgi:hypothetical protein
MRNGLGSIEPRLGILQRRRGESVITVDIQDQSTAWSVVLRLRLPKTNFAGLLSCWASSQAEGGVLQ